MKFSLFKKKVVAFVLLIACINLFMGCHRFYRPVAVNTVTAESKQTSLKTLSEQNRYFILRKGIHSYALTNIVIDQTNMTLTANVGQVPLEHSLYINKGKSTRYTYSKAKLQDVVLTEVHLFTGDTSMITNTSNPYTISLANVQKVERIDFDKQRTTSSHVWGAIGITLGVALVVLIIAAATYTEPAPPPPTTTGSCPYISTFNGKSYELQGEIYSAALYPSLQKDDYLPLVMDPANGEYRIKISNDLKEIQHTDFADLLVVEHDKNVKVLIDPSGKPHSIATPQLPVSASLNNNLVVTDQLIAKDNISCLFKADNGARQTEDLFITFKNEGKSKNGKLILSAKSSSWLIYLYNEFTRGFGGHYDKWIKEQEKRPGTELEKWADDQHIPLTISVKTDNGWKEIQKIKSIGPLLTRDVVIAVDLTGDETTEFKISGGYMFWELDYAAMDYSPDADFKVQAIKPYEAVNEQGANVLPLILSADKIYLDQPNIGDSTILKYKSIDTKEGMTQTVFLHSSGYYKHIRDYSGSPKVAFLKSFNQPGALAAFSRQKYAEAWDKIATAKN